jgi:serine O-acetyltransferase
MNALVFSLTPALKPGAEGATTHKPFQRLPFTRQTRSMHRLEKPVLMRFPCQTSRSNCAKILISFTPAFRPVLTAAATRKPFNGFSHFTLSLFFTLSGRIFRLMATTMRDAIEELLHTYGETGGINYLAAAASLPSRLSIEAACTELMSLMFPGFRSEALVSSEDLADTTRIRVRHLHARLKTEICRSLGRIPPDQETEAKAEEVLTEFFKQLPSVRRMLWTDIDAAYEGDPAATTYEEIILAYPALEAIAIYRTAHLLYGKVPLIPRIMTEWAHSRTGIDIHPGAQIGSHFFIDHGTGVVVGETTQIGSHVKLYQGVSFIARSLGAGQALRGKKRHPTIEDGVCIYAGTTIMGGDTVIGANSTIGANVFLTKSVPPRSLVYYEEKEVRVVPKRKHEAATTQDEFQK